jgi:hypothetical protein
MDDKNESFVEEVALKSFLGNEVDFAELAIAKDTNDFVRIYADYFAGEPIGGKRFFVHNNELIGVEVILLVENISENGSFVVEETSNLFFYYQGKIQQVWDNRIQENVDVASISWTDEHLLQWEVIKQYIDLTPTLE